MDQALLTLTDDQIVTVLTNAAPQPLRSQTKARESSNGPIFKDGGDSSDSDGGDSDGGDADS